MTQKHPIPVLPGERESNFIRDKDVQKTAVENDPDILSDP